MSGEARAGIKALCGDPYDFADRLGHVLESTTHDSSRPWLEMMKAIFRDMKYVGDQRVNTAGPDVYVGSDKLTAHGRKMYLGPREFGLWRGIVYLGDKKVTKHGGSTYLGGDKVSPWSSLVSRSEAEIDP